MIDPGLSHSYLSARLIVEHGLRVEPANKDILVTNPLGQSVIVSRVCRDCPLQFGGYEFSGDLMELSFQEFDAILGMDWLFRHSASVDCRLKRITLLVGDGETVDIMGERLDDSVSFVSAMEAVREIGFEFLVQMRCDHIHHDLCR